MSQGKAGGLTRQKSRQSFKNRSYYDRQYFVTTANKTRRAAARARWLARRQSPEVCEVMAGKWSLRHKPKPADSTHIVRSVERYGKTVLTTVRTKASYAA